MKLKISDEKLRDELAQLHFLKNCDDDELSTMSGCMGRVEPRFSGFCHGWDEATKYHQSKVDKLTEIISKMKSALKFYSLKSNYSIVDEGRNYNVEYVTYELNEETYADEDLGLKARATIEEVERMEKELNKGE